MVRSECEATEKRNASSDRIFKKKPFAKEDVDDDDDDDGDGDGDSDVVNSTL